MLSIRSERQMHALSALRHPHAAREGEGATVTPSLLIVDDDPDLRGLIATYLSRNGLSVAEAGDALQMDQALARQRFDLIILDLMMPGEDGLSILRRIRGNGCPPVIMLSAMGEDSDRIIGLEVGADDYVAKPCNPRELLARVRAVLRRDDHGIASNDQQKRRFGSWILDLQAREVARDGEAPVRLTDAEYRVLRAFLDRPQRILTRDQLIDASRSIDSDVLDRAIDVTISRLRKKLGTNDLIRTLRGEGYMFAVKASVA
jgi:two-component system OmpR family response regulator